MIRTVDKEYATFLTQAGTDLMGRVMRGETTIKLSQCRVGDGLWSVTRNENELPGGGTEVNYTIDVPEVLASPIANGLFDIDTLTDNSAGVTEARVNVPPTFGPATINEAEWLLDDGTVYAITRYAALPAMPSESGGGSEVSLRAMLRVGDVESVSLVVESGVTASRDFVESEIQKIDDRVTGQVDQLSQTVTDLPVGYLVTSPLLTGDAEQSYGNNVSLSVSGGVSPWGGLPLNVVVDHYEWQKPDGSVVNGPSLLWPIPNDAALVDTTYTFKVRAVDTLNHHSAWVERVVTVVGNRRPNVDAFTDDVPDIAVRNQAVVVHFSGATDPDGDDSQITYRISNPINLVASKSTAIAPGEAVTLTFDNVGADSTAGITVVAVDGQGVQSAPQTITVDLRYQAIVEKPTGLAPAANAVDIAQQPQVAGSAFVTNPVGFATHNATNIRVATDEAMANIVVNMALGVVTTAQLDTALALNTKHWYQIQYGTAELGVSAWSDPVPFTTVAAELPQSLFAVTSYGGNGVPRTISTGLNLLDNGGLIWSKGRTIASDNRLIDTVRGLDSVMTSNSTDAPHTDASLITAVSETGYNIGSGNSAINSAGHNYISWAFKKAPKFLDIVTWVGNDQSGRQIPHELGVEPGMIIVRPLTNGNATNVYHRSLSISGKRNLYLQSSQAQDNNGAKFFGNDTNMIAPTDTHFTIGGGAGANTDGVVYLAYVFAHDTDPNGVIQCGSYNGNGYSGGPMVALGWGAQFVMVKAVTASEPWVMWDSKRGEDSRLMANDNSVESGNPTISVDFDSPTGFQLQGNNSQHNGAGIEYIYLAIRAPIPV